MPGVSVTLKFDILKAIEEVKKFFSHGVNAKNLLGETPLQMTLELFKFPLTKSEVSSLVELVDVLLDKSADVNMPNVFDNTPLVTLFISAGSQLMEHYDVYYDARAFKTI